MPTAYRSRPITPAKGRHEGSQLGRHSDLGGEGELGLGQVLAGQQAAGVDRLGLGEEVRVLAAKGLLRPQPLNCRTLRGRSVVYLDHGAAASLQGLSETNPKGPAEDWVSLGQLEGELRATLLTDQ